ncbi:MAG: hypothetical protein HON94_06225 [Methylococcales bacterium]|nr:hypothetical protein [Methylococcales bacterium]
MVVEYYHHYLVLQVQDSDIGMSLEKITDIFKPFTQIDDSETRINGGTGLGLAVCDSFAKLLHGDITVRSEIGKGAVFSLKLPVKSEGYT